MIIVIFMNENNLNGSLTSMSSMRFELLIMVYSVSHYLLKNIIGGGNKPGGSGV